MLNIKHGSCENSLWFELTENRTQTFRFSSMRSINCKSWITKLFLKLLQYHDTKYSITILLLFPFFFLRTEAEYAFKCKTPVVPIKLENNYDPDGWLGKFEDQNAATDQNVWESG